MMDLEKLEALAKAAPSGQWEVWTSNSWRRVMAGNTPAIVPCVQRYDNHPDLSLASGVKEWLEGVTPETVLALIAEVRTLRDENAGLQQAYLRCIVETSDAQAIADGVIEALENIVAAHDMHCEHHVRVSSHSYDLARMAQDALDACKEPQ